MVETITMTKKELSRYEVIKHLLNKEINGTEASEQLGLSVRQTKNIKAKVLRLGPKGIIHQNRGRPSNRKLSEERIETIKRVVRAKYPDFGPTFASEKLFEIDQIKINKETLRGLMIQWGLWKPKSRKRAKEYRLRFAGAWYQLNKQQPVLVRPKDKIRVEERLDGTIHLSLKDKLLSFALLPERPPKIKIPLIALSGSKPAWRPPANHPWRHQLFFGKEQRSQVSTPPLPDQQGAS